MIHVKLNFTCTEQNYLKQSRTLCVWNKILTQLHTLNLKYITAQTFCWIITSWFQCTDNAFFSRTELVLFTERPLLKLISRCKWFECAYLFSQTKNMLYVSYHNHVTRFISQMDGRLRIRHKWFQIRWNLTLNFCCDSCLKLSRITLHVHDAFTNTLQFKFRQCVWLISIDSTTDKHKNTHT